MHFLILSVICSVLVSVLLKLAPRRGIDIAQAVTWNYLAASMLSLWLLKPSLASLQTPDTPWPALLVLAVALPGIFLVLARSVREAGIVRTDVAQRLSLLLSLLAAFALFGEQASGPKLAGLALGLLAIAGVTARPQRGQAGTGAATWPWLLAVWCGFALIDVMLKQVALAGTPSTAALLVSFALAFVLMLGWQLWRHARGSAPLRGRNLGFGLLLGTINFGNILFYVRAHQALPESPAVVFAGMNIGVVVLGTLVGILAFGEATSRWNRAGLVLAVVAIGLIARG
ncbi:EamA family transporter [Flavobacterium sp. MXW15]|uniref:EamA family transporter n=1 Tax=Xanthomonas chitinilytica TaxID=2989819 RepID=A0ABT3K0J2_9XANT|nr:EamA family transporter [Xanthomonas sp. H13-6]MCW4456552.1 EamA family transporter [Flavobacterium sp. MXW15]MCW4474255.1 EamA family transporter [Xanthomonas sp. H13-6]